MVITEILAIGNELLLGDVLDTNTQWLCRRIAGLGGRVTRVTTVGDEPEAIADALRGALTRGARVIFTSGGLGPTTDDLTLSAIAQALRRPLIENPQALAMLQETYARLMNAGYVTHDALTEERRKMARLPAGAQPVHNPVGAAPGVVLREGETTIICLPGVPAELKGIFEESLLPRLKELYGEGYFAERTIQVACGDESVLAPLVNRLAAHHSRVYVKSRAKPYGPDVQLKITLSASGEDRDEVNGLLERALHDLQQGLSELGIGIISIS